MNRLELPYPGRLLTAQLCAYGLAAALDAEGERAFVGHDPEALELTPIVTTEAPPQRVAECIRVGATACRAAIDADVVPGLSGNARIPVIRARATDPVGQTIALRMREDLLDQLEAAGNHLAAALLAGIGSPAPWLSDSAGKQFPHRGASQLDGVPYNIGSDVVRGFLRRCVDAGQNASESDLDPQVAAAAGVEDRTRWSPAKTTVSPLFQWLAALGLTLLPVGQVAGSRTRVQNRARTPAFWRESGRRGITLPILSGPVSISRLRALLQRPELLDPGLDPVGAGKLRSLGVRELAIFSVVEASNSTMVSFSFSPATLIEL